MWKGTLFKRRAPDNVTAFSRSKSFNRVQTVTANYKFSEKIKYLKPWTITLQFNRMRARNDKFI